QVITVSRNLSTQDVEQFITYPVELEMANLPGVEEIRSVSKFGLSVVTVVFSESMGTYLPRQLIAEKLSLAAEKIPEEFGKPELGPITTGLGEIYQYTLEVKPEYTALYSLTELREIQDWIVKRQLSGIPGVVEINTWGGKLKQYEVAVNPSKLAALNISIQQIYNALKANNSLVGGGYIEKEGTNYFIRSEGLLSSLEDINNVTITTRKGLPVYLKDIASVSFGSAIRFGAITGNGQGEKVLGQIMMLKNADSKKTIAAVKDRVAEVQKSLPEGVYINPFLERSELVEKTTFTIAENLIFGCLIVIFVVVLLLGNFRSGLVIASVIPLSLMFAISLMYLLGIDANLLSLGAIDFGIIIDGAVIITEFVAYKIFKAAPQIKGISIPAERHQRIDELVIDATHKMMRPAVFGQLIILIVFIPILSLTGVEGKMFRPMALTFGFALLGAMLLCFTYVPAMTAVLARSRNMGKSAKFSERLIDFIKKLYQPALFFAYAHKRLTLGVAAFMLLITALVFSRMGGEFVPTLDEGDFVIQPVLKTGTS
ncbi:MAG: efflux RND transporter permease subunit, partial [Flavobacteriaceae bacterium]|nr:efflux RND transporter permease subunit [Flavobacteriaceae bacterium]